MPNNHLGVVATHLALSLIEAMGGLYSVSYVLMGFTNGESKGFLSSLLWTVGQK